MVTDYFHLNYCNSLHVYLYWHVLLAKLAFVKSFCNCYIVDQKRKIFGSFWHVGFLVLRKLTMLTARRSLKTGFTHIRATPVKQNAADLFLRKKLSLAILFNTGFDKVHFTQTTLILSIIRCDVISAFPVLMQVEENLLLLFIYLFSRSCAAFSPRQSRRNLVVFLRK